MVARKATIPIPIPHPALSLGLTPVPALCLVGAASAVNLQAKDVPQTFYPPRLYPWADTGPWVLTHVLRPSVALPGIGPPGAPTPEVMRAGKRDAFAATLSPFRPTVECAVGRH